MTVTTIIIKHCMNNCRLIKDTQRVLQYETMNGIRVTIKKRRYSS